MNALYENSSKLTESHYKESPWPSPDSVSQFFEDGEKKEDMTVLTNLTRDTLTLFFGNRRGIHHFALQRILLSSHLRKIEAHFRNSRSKLEKLRKIVPIFFGCVQTNPKQVMSHFENLLFRKKKKIRCKGAKCDCHPKVLAVGHF